MGRIADWAATFGNANTRRVNIAGLYAFLDHLYGKQRATGHVTKKERETYEVLLDQYFGEGRDQIQDLMVFAASLHDSPPNTANNYMNALREFLAIQGREITDREWKRIRLKLPKGGTRTIERDMDHETLRKILHHLDLKGKAFVLFLATTGMRRGEAAQIQIDDVDLDTTPAEITIRGEYTKNGQARFSFLTEEARQALVEWLAVRDQYMRSAQNRNAGLVAKGRAKERPLDDMRLFPFTKQVVNEFWLNALKKAKLLSYDKTTNRSQLHIHQLRKFFLSQTSLVISKEVPETLAGHSGYLTGAYRRYTKGQLAEEYLKAEAQLTLMAPKDYKEVQSEFRTRMADQSVIVERIVAKNLKLEEEIATLRAAADRTAALEDEVAGMRATLGGIVELLESIGEGQALWDQLRQAGRI